MNFAVYLSNSVFTLPPFNLYLCCFLQAVTNINTLLDKADRVYHQLMGHRPQLESLLSKVNEAAPEKPQVSHTKGMNST